MNNLELFEVLELSDFDDVSQIDIQISEKSNKSMKSNIMSRISYKNSKRLLHKMIIISAACLLLAFSISITALANDEFRQFVFTILNVTNKIADGDKQQNIVKTFEFGNEYVVHEGFIITNKGNTNEKVFEYQNGKVVISNRLSCSGVYNYLDKPIKFSFDFYIHKDGIYVINQNSNLKFSLSKWPNDISKAVFIVLGVDTNDILENGMTVTNNAFVDSWLIDLKTGKLEPLVNREGANDFLGKKIISVDKVYDGTYVSYKTRNFAEVDMGKDENYILFKSNRNHFPADEKYDYYIHDRITGDEWFIQMPTKDIPYKVYWVDDYTVAFLHLINNKVVVELYNVKDRTFKVSGKYNTDEFAHANASLYEIAYDKEEYKFTDIFCGKKLNIKNSKILGQSIIASWSQYDCYVVQTEQGLYAFNLKLGTCLFLTKQDLHADKILFPGFVDQNVMLICTESVGDSFPSFYFVTVK